MDILKRFGMLDCKSIATLMDANLKKLRDSASDSNLFNLAMYHQLIGSFMYLTNTKRDICFAVNALISSCANRGRFTGLLQNICSDTYVALWDMVYDMIQNVI